MSGLSKDKSVITFQWAGGHSWLYWSAEARAIALCLE